VFAMLADGDKPKYRFEWRTQVVRNTVDKVIQLFVGQFKLGVLHRQLVFGYPQVADDPASYNGENEQERCAEKDVNNVYRRIGVREKEGGYNVSNEKDIEVGDCSRTKPMPQGDIQREYSIKEPEFLKGQEVGEQEHDRKHDGQFENLFPCRRHVGNRLGGRVDEEIVLLHDWREEHKHRQGEAKVCYELRKQVSGKIMNSQLTAMLAKIDLKRLEQGDLN